MLCVYYEFIFKSPHMKQKFSAATVMTLLSIVFFLSSCEVVGDLMKTSFWAGAIFVIAIIALIIFVVVRMGKKS